MQHKHTDGIQERHCKASAAAPHVQCNTGIACPEQASRRWQYRRWEAANLGIKVCEHEALLRSLQACHIQLWAEKTAESVLHTRVRLHALEAAHPVVQRLRASEGVRIVAGLPSN